MNDEDIYEVPVWFLWVALWFAIAGIWKTIETTIFIWRLFS